MVAGLGLVVFAVHGWTTLTFPGQVDYGEGGTMLASWRLAQGQTPYPDPNQAPYLVNPYTPLFLLAGAAFMGEGPDLWGGRLVSILAGSCTMVLLALHLGRRSGALTALAGVSFFVVHPLVLGWSPLFRTDMLALFFEMTGLALAHRSLDPARRTAAGVDDGLTTLAMVLALFTKQSMLAGLLAWLAVLALEDRGRFVRALALAAALLGLPTLVLQTATDGWFLRMTVSQNMLPFSIDLALLAAGFYGPTAAGLPILAAASPPSRERLWWLFLVASLPIAVGTGRAGGFFNYYLELHLALCALAGLGLANLVATGTRLAGLATALALVQVLLCGGATGLPPYLHSPLQHLRFETVPALTGQTPGWVTHSRRASELRPWLEAYPGPLLAENLADPAVAGRVPWVVDPFLLFLLAESDRWDEEPVLKRIDQGGFALVVLQRLGPNLRFPPRVMHRVLARYRVAGRAGEDFILVPRPPASVPGLPAGRRADGRRGGRRPRWSSRSRSRCCRSRSGSPPRPGRCASPHHTSRRSYRSS